MATQFYTGFNGITTAQIARRFPGSSGTIVIDAHGRFGQSCQLDQASGGLPVTITGSPTTVAVGLSVKMTGASSSNRPIFSINGGGSAHVNVWWDASTSTIKIAAPGNTVVFTSAVVSLNLWYWIEVLTTIHDTTGTITFKLNGVPVYTATGLDTKNGSTGYVDQVSFGGNFLTFYTDCIYINDSTGAAPQNGLMGEVRCDRLDTSANDTVAFTPLSGTNESNIDDGNTPDDDSTYNESTVVADRDLFTVSGYSAPVGGAILGVCVRVMASKPDAGTRTLRAVLKSSATVSTGTTIGLSSSYQEAAVYAQVDPATSAAWINSAAVNAVKIGYEVVA